MVRRLGPTLLTSEFTKSRSKQGPQRGATATRRPSPELLPMRVSSIVAETNVWRVGTILMSAPELSAEGNLRHHHGYRGGCPGRCIWLVLGNLTE